MESQEEEQYQLKCEMKQCCICKDWIDCTNNLIILKHKHYHKSCIIYYRSIHFPSVVRNIF